MRKFMRTRAPPAAHPPPHHNGHAQHQRTNGKTNGHAHGEGGAPDHSPASSRYCSGSEGSAPPLWEDSEFPAAWRALGDRRLAAGVQWLRPHKLCAVPRFRGDDAQPDAEEPDDVLAARWRVRPGELGDAHLCCGAAALALTPRLLDRVAPPQSFGAPYCGLFRFRFWVFGAWREVLVDDRLPTRGGRLLASCSALHDDFTLPLLEKAYAKLYGSYRALRSGSVARALQDLSGGVVQSFALRHQSRALTFQVLNSAVARSTLLVSSAADGAEGGLVAGQPYCVTGLARLRDVSDGVLVRVRAVTAHGVWTGAWAPHSDQWRALADADRELLAQRARRPGDFWMSFGDFARWFARLQLVHVGPDDWLAEPALRARRPWRAVLARRRWRLGYNAGGPPRAPTAHANPRFHVHIPRSGATLKCHVVVSVTQAYGTRTAARRLHAIGFAVYEAPSDEDSAPHELRALDMTHESRAREVVTFFTLPPGRYLVVPHTRRAHTDVAFLLRILTDEHADVWEANDDNMVVRDVPAELLGDPRAVPAEVRAALSEVFSGQESEEVEAGTLRAVPRRVWRACQTARPSAALCRALVALADGALAGAARRADVPALVALVAYWRATFLRHAALRRAACWPRASSYHLRALLWAAGITASNKVLESLVLRFARGARLSADDYMLALARLHLAHERYRCLDAKLKANPLSLEEMILMTLHP